MQVYSSAKTLALEYTGSEVTSGCKTAALGSKSSLVPFIIQARKKKQEDKRNRAEMAKRFRATQEVMKDLGIDERAEPLGLMRELKLMMLP